jgi:transposase
LVIAFSQLAPEFRLAKGLSKFLLKQLDSHVDKNLYREYGRAPRGIKIYVETKGKKIKRKLIVAAKCGNEIVAPLMYDGTMDGMLFKFWVENSLMPAIEKGSIIIMDNATVHNKNRLSSIADNNGIRMIFQPAYSPDLNKMEHFWSWLKKKLRKILPKYETLEEAICGAFRIYEDLFCHTSQV